MSDRPDWLVNGADVLVIYNAGRSTEWTARTTIKNVAAKFFSLQDYPERFRIDDQRHRRTDSYGYDAVVPCDSDEARQAIARQRRRNLESKAQRACYTFTQNHCRENRKAALEALEQYDSAMNAIDK